MFDTILLKCIKNINGERSVSAVYHLLNGKRSSQTLQDAHIFKVKGYFGIHKKLNKQTFNDMIAQLSSHGYIMIDRAVSAKLTSKGSAFLADGVKKMDTSMFNGMKYHKKADNFYERLLLFIQTATNVESGNHRFVPITEKPSILLWVKNLYFKEKENLKPLLADLYYELNSELVQFPDLEASIFVQRLTGHSRIGWSKVQIAHTHNITYNDVEVIITLIIHKLLFKIETSPSDFPILKTFTEGLLSNHLVTESAYTTFMLLNRGLDAAQIADKRLLKLSTIQDHIVEIVLSDPTFVISSYISDVAKDQIIETSQTLATNRLKVIREKLDNKYSYFEIRLALAAKQVQLG